MYDLDKFVQEQEAPRMSLQVEDICFPDYYQGHGHILDEDPPSVCVPFAFPVNFTETCGEIANRVFRSLNEAYCWEDYALQELTPAQVQALQSIPDEAIQETIHKDITAGGDTLYFPSEIPIDEYQEELPYVYGHLHIWL